MAKQSINFVEVFTKPLAVGTRVTCIGTPSAEYDRFSVNIGSGEFISLETNDIAVHIRVDCSDQEVVLNTQHEGNWGQEESSSSPCPFETGQQFKIEMEIRENDTVLKVNGADYCTFKHRDPSPLSATWMLVENLMDVMLKTETPETFIASPVTLKPDPYKESPIKCTKTLTELLTVGTRIVFTGTASSDVSCVAFNIGCGDIAPNADIAVHLNVFFPGRYAIWHTRRCGEWQDTFIDTNWTFPFELDKEFKLEVLINERDTVWTVDGEHYKTHDHKNPSPLSATWLRVTGLKDARLKIEKPETCQ